MFFVVGFLWLVLAPAGSIAIQISPEAGLRNASIAIIRTADDVIVPIPMESVANRTLGTEISTSERTRRLIPYMAFYLPPAEFPINQQYVVQVPSKQLQHQSPQKSQKQQHQPAAIPIPTAYVHMKVPLGGQHQQTHHNSHNHYQSQAPVFQTIAYGGQHPLTQVKEKVKVPPLQHSLLPPGGGAQRVPIPFAYKEGINIPKSKSIGQQQQQYHQLQSPVQLQKINMTPFTPTNTVPGHFIPIIYTNEQANSVNNFKPTAPSSPSIVSHQQQQQQYQDLSNIGQLEDHQLQHPSHSSGGHKQENSEEYLRHRPHGEVVVNIPASPVPSSQQVVPKTLSQIQQQERQHIQYVSVSPTPGSGQSATYRIVGDSPTENRHHHHQQQQQQHHQSQTTQLFEQQFSNGDALTPQQKYVIYLQQQLRYKQQQQFQEHQEKHTQLEKHLQQQSQSHQQQQQQHYQSQQPNRHYSRPDSIYVLSTTASPAPSSTAHPSTQNTDSHRDNHHNQNRFNEKYPQHSPINHVVYPNPEVITDPEQILHPKKQQQQTTSYQRDGFQYAPQQLQPHQYQSNPNYVEYIIDEPKQEIEEHSAAPEKDQHQDIRPPPVLLISSTGPAPPPVEVVVTSPRPLYKNQPTLRLHAISSTPRATPRPYTKSPYNSNKATTAAPPMVFVSSKPKYTRLFPTATPTPIKLKPSQKYTVDSPKYVQRPDEDPLPDIKTSSLAEILRKLQESNHLPQTITPDNVDNSIRTLIKILQNLKQSQTIVENPQQHHEEEYDYNNAGNEDEGAPAQQDLSAPTVPNAKPGPNSGRPGIDYPTLANIPATSFDCQEQRYKGFFGDPETNCQVWHYCDLNGGKASFLCPNGTIFSQIALTCDWWFNVKCATTTQLYVLNERLYKYILPFTPKFPEDYSGPLVDKYLALKFKEMEDKMRREKLKGRDGGSEDSSSDGVTETLSEDESTEPIKSKNEGSSGNGVGIKPSLIGEQSSERNLLIDEENGRIASRANVIDTYSSTQATAKELPLSLQPIVVSTTASPFAINSEEDESTSSEARSGDKISVEKVDIIEIKSDGSSGHLIPDNRYGSAET